MRTDLSSIVSRQLPEFIREDYPTFVSFVEAYYDWLKTQQVDLTDSRDLDKTLDQYIEYFRKELAVHLPLMLEDERLVLPRIKELYLAKGSQSSFKLLFRLLYGKNVEIDYPGQQMLKASDGTWNQEISIFAKVEYGDPDEVVGRLVDIVTAGRTIRVLVDRREVLTGEVDRIVALGGNIYEFFLDKRFFGNINVGDKIKYKEIFQAEILPATQKPTILQPGKNFRVGQVFNINSGGGTGALLKVTQVTPEGGIKYCELIKFGIGYTSDFGISLLASNSINTFIADAPLSSSTIVGGNLSIKERTLGFDEQGYVNYADYVSYDYVDGTYAGTVAREFALNYRNAQTSSTDGAQLSIKLGALVRYPGYYTSNRGFLDDSVKIQDSFYYQKYSYVVKIDERLDSYKAAVKTLLHPTGMKLFGEYNINNEFDLSIALDCVVKSLRIGLEDYILDVNDENIDFVFGKRLTDSQSITEAISGFNVFKAVNTHKLYDGVTSDNNNATPTDSKTLSFTKAIGTHKLYDGVTSDNNSVSMQDAIIFTNEITKLLGSQLLFGGVTIDNTSVTMTHSETFNFTKSLGDSQSITDITSLNITKPLADTTVGTWSNSGEVWKNPYQAEDYFATTTYVEGLVATFTN